MKKYEALLIVMIISLLALVGVAVYTDYKVSDGKIVTTKKQEEHVKNTTEEQSTTEEETTTKKEEKHEVTLVAVGDILIHTPLLDEGHLEDGSYDFKFLFEIMKEDFKTADLAIVNQESVLGGPEIGYDGYPNFNSPDEVGEAIVDAGFDVVLHATNHARDVGMDGIYNTIEFWKKRADKITMLGFNETPKEHQAARYIEKNGIKFALFNFTYGLNGYSLAEGEEHRVNLLDDANREKIVSEIQKAEKEADFVIAFPHWGNEDQLKEVSDFQVQWANILTDAGVDLIIGSHPHVLQKVEWIKTEAGNKSLCYYSVGNYISNQQELNEVLGGMAKLKIVKENGKTAIDESAAGMVPIVTQNDRRGAKPLIQTYHLADYTQEMAQVHDIHNRFDSTFSLERLQNTANDVLGDWLIQ